MSSKHYKTSDLYLATFLETNDFEIVKVTPTSEDSDRKVFVFQNSPELKSLVEAYYIEESEEKLQVSVKEFTRCLKNVKNKLFNS